jgi:hypothetical protein
MCCRRSETDWPHNTDGCQGRWTKKTYWTVCYKCELRYWCCDLNVIVGRDGLYHVFRCVLWGLWVCFSLVIALYSYKRISFVILTFFYICRIACVDTLGVCSMGGYKSVAFLFSIFYIIIFLSEHGFFFSGLGWQLEWTHRTACCCKYYALCVLCIANYVAAFILLSQVK